MSIAFIHNKRPGVAVFVPVPHEHSYTTEVIPPTCTERGYTTHTCKCGDSYKSDYVDALGHTFGEKWHSDENGHWHICSVCGEKSEVIEHLAGAEATTDTPQTCVVCGYVIVPALHAHAYSDWETVVAATCTTAGQKRRSCPCGAIETMEVPALGHNITSTVTEPPTCAKVGWRWNWCTRCDYAHYSPIETVAHTEETINAVPATCTESGSSAGSKCAVCNSFLKEPETILPYGHNLDGSWRWSFTYHWKHCTRCATTEMSTGWHTPVYSPSVDDYYCEVCGAPTDSTGTAYYTNYAYSSNFDRQGGI